MQIVMTIQTQKIEFDGAKLADLREERGFSQAEVARHVGIRPQSLCGIEKNKHNPSAVTLMKLCLLFNVNPQDFVRS
jgi:DNA-binding XRE family transcriptional regulator